MEKEIGRNFSERRKGMQAYFLDPETLDARFHKVVMGEHLDMHEGGIIADVAAEKKATQFHGIVGMMDQLHKEKLGKPILAGSDEDRTLVGIILPIHKSIFDKHLLLLNGKISIIEPNVMSQRQGYHGFVVGTGAHNMSLRPDAFCDDKKTLKDEVVAAMRVDIFNGGINFKFSSDNPKHHDILEKAAASALSLIEEERHAREARKEEEIAVQVAAFSKQIDVFVNDNPEPDLEEMFKAASFDPESGKTKSE